MPVEDPENTLKGKAVFQPTARAFARLAVLSLLTALLVRLLEIGAGYLGAETPPAGLPSASHLLAVGLGGSLLGLLLIRERPGLVPDPAGRKGIGPRTFWIFAAGLALHAVFEPLAGPDRPFFAILSLAGLLLELVAALSLAFALR